MPAQEWWESNNQDRWWEMFPTPPRPPVQSRAAKNFYKTLMKIAHKRALVKVAARYNDCNLGTWTLRDLAFQAAANGRIVNGKAERY